MANTGLSSPCCSTVIMSDNVITENGAPSSNLVDISLTPELRNKVFGNDLIRKEIFKYVMFNGREISMENVRACRLVQWDWNYNVASLLQNSGSPLFSISFQYWNESLEEQNRLKKYFQVRNFIETWVTSSDAGSALLFELIFTNYSFRIPEGALHDLVRCLTRCGNGLQSLSLHLDQIPPTRTDDIVNFSVPPDFTLYLPNLKILDVFLTQGTDNRMLAILLMSPILSGCQQLSTLKITCWSKETGFYDALQNLPLPDTLKAIKFYGSMTTQMIEGMLLGNALPSLTKLSLKTDEPCESDVIFRIMGRFCHQLQEFSIYSWPGIESTTFMDFPVMSKLLNFKVSGGRYEFHENVSSLKQFFPAIENLNFKKQSGTTLCKWIGNFRYMTVKKVTLHIYDSSDRVDKDEHFTLELSHRLYTSFQYVQDLAISITGWIRNGSIQNIFQMVQLKKLSILQRRLSEENWDAILLGVTPEYAEDLAFFQDQWDAINLDHDRLPSCSIVNLTELTTLHLSQERAYRHQEAAISDVSFRFAFFNMPNLHELKLEGRFKVSDLMCNEWRRRGHQIL